MKTVWDDFPEVKNRRKNYSAKMTLEGFDHRAQFDKVVGRYLTPETVLLDVACGFADHLAVYGRGAKEVIGIDTSESMLKQAKDLAAEKGMTLLLMDMEDLSFEDGKFDIVTSVFGPQSYKSCAEAFRVLKRGGRYVRTCSGGEFVEYEGRPLTRPVDVVGRGMNVDKRPGQMEAEETDQIRKAGFRLDEGVKTFKGIKVFDGMDNLVDYLRMSGHFKFFPPYRHLDEAEVTKLYKNMKKFEMKICGRKVFGMPIDSLLFVATKRRPRRGARGSF